MPNGAELITEHGTVTVECVDRLCLNAYVPRLQSEGGSWPSCTTADTRSRPRRASVRSPTPSRPGSARGPPASASRGSSSRKGSGRTTGSSGNGTGSTARWG